jgi:hypothetical protein
MSCLRPTQVISNWIGDNSLIESDFISKIFTNKVNSVFYTEDDVRLQMYYKQFYEQQIVVNKKTEWIILPKEHVPYQPTLLPTPPMSLSQRPLVYKAKDKGIPHSATAPHVDMPDVFLLGP